MTPAPKYRDSVGEWAIVAIVVIVLGVAATGTRLESAPMMPVLTQAMMVSPISPDRLASQTRMISPIGRNCVRAEGNDHAQCALPDASIAPD